MVGVGVGVSVREAEGGEDPSQLQRGSDPLLEAGIDQGAAGLGPPTLDLIADLSERRLRPGTGFSSHRATRLSDR
jgi:hypothetical protein